MTEQKSFHSLCRWTFNAGKGGFVPSAIRESWSEEKLAHSGAIQIIKNEIKPRLPGHIVLGYELHYDNEVNEQNADQIADALSDAGMFLAMLTPGAHIRLAYGGIASLDEEERKTAGALGFRAVDLAYGKLRRTWHPENDHYPTLVLWNGSWGYDLVTIGIRKMYQFLKEGVAELCRYEEKKGSQLYIAIEPKPNEGHAAMLLPTVASAILFWKRLSEEFDISLPKKGINKEFGHSEMIGLDHVYDTVEEIDNRMLVHMHNNSQGYNDGLILGGPGKFDLDNGVRINGMNIAIAGLTAEAGYQRWKGHDMQPRPYDNEVQAADRVVRSILSWEACERAAKELDEILLMQYLTNRQTARAEDLMREAVMLANVYFDELYG